MLREFETTFILQPEITDEGVQSVCARVDQILEKNGAVRLLYDDDGKRRLAYEIKHFQKGHYLTVHYFDTGKAVSEVERALRLDESVLRFLTVRVADEVGDVEERKKQAAEEEKIRAERAKERAEIEAREAREREANEALRLGAAAEEDSEESEDEDEGER